jgi:hypothetical protein
MGRPEPLLALVGGFLGAGKTTLLLRAAAMLREQGARAAVIMNDHGGALVDTRLAADAGIPAGEVVGGCYCCRFSDFVASAERLLAFEPDVIFAEPVGSCIDIAATTLRPMRALHGDRFRLAPFTVLVDPAKAWELLAPGADPSLAYLFRNQLAEADLVCLTKSDLRLDPPELPGGYTLSLSARTGDGVSTWLKEILDGSRLPAARTMEVDYGVYAGAEAALGWLNWQATLELRRALSPAMVVGPLMDALDRGLTERGAVIAHLKLLDRTRTGAVKAAVCRNREEPVVEGALFAQPSRKHELLVNLRALASPAQLKQVMDHAAGELPGKVSVAVCECFSPAPPKPEHRMD